MSRQHLSWQHLSISGVFQLLLTRFWPNFNGRFLGPCLTDANCLATKIFSKFFFQTQFFSKIFSDTKSIGPKIFWTHNFFGPKVFRPKIISDPWFFFGPNFCLGLGDFHWRRGIKPFQAEHFRHKSCLKNNYCPLCCLLSMGKTVLKDTFYSIDTVLHYQLYINLQKRNFHNCLFEIEIQFWLQLSRKSVITSNILWMCGY